MATTMERDLGMNAKRMPTNDMFQTSTGVGHHWRPGYYFPDSGFTAASSQPLPDELTRPSKVRPDDLFTTTSRSAHEPKRPAAPLNRDIEFKRAPALYYVHYLKDHKEKLGHGGWRRPLSPSHQVTETQEEFRNRPPLSEPNTWGSKPQPFLLRDHHGEGSTKLGVASTQNPKLRGRPLFPKDTEVLRGLDMYLTSNERVHRRFDPKELSGYPKKDIATYWDCEEYPKAWGHGPHENLLPKHAVPRDRLPMRDELRFKSATTVRRMPQRLPPPAHMGMKTLYSDSYARPSDARVKEARECPVDTPWMLPASGARSAMTAPQMYKTEYYNVGSKKTITV